MLIFLQTFCKIHLDSMLQPQNCQVLCASWFYTTCPEVVWMSELRKRKRVKLPHKTSSIKRRSLFGSCGGCSENIICKLFKNIKCIWENSHFQSWVSFFWKGWFNRTKWKMIQLFINWFLSRCFGNNLLLLPDPFIQTTSVLRKCSH